MTWNNLAALIAALPADQRKKNVRTIRPYIRGTGKVCFFVGNKRSELDNPQAKVGRAFLMLPD